MATCDQADDQVNPAAARWALTRDSDGKHWDGERWVDGEPRWAAAPLEMPS